MTFGSGLFFGVKGYPTHYTMLSHIPGLSPHKMPMVMFPHHDHPNGLQILPGNTESRELIEVTHSTGRWMELSKWRQGCRGKERLEQNLRADKTQAKVLPVGNH